MVQTLITQTSECRFELLFGVDATGETPRISQAAFIVRYSESVIENLPFQECVVQY